jgi:hypothetical protein
MFAGYERILIFCPISIDILDSFKGTPFRLGSPLSFWRVVNIRARRDFSSCQK